MLIIVTVVVIIIIIIVIIISIVFDANIIWVTHKANGGEMEELHTPVHYLLLYNNFYLFYFTKRSPPNSWLLYSNTNNLCTVYSDGALKLRQGRSQSTNSNIISDTKHLD